LNIMKIHPVLSGLGVAAVAAVVLGVAPPAFAAPNCVAQSVRSEHALYGTTWGRDVVALLASQPEVLEEFGFGSFGELARFAASQDPAVCPPGL
jgi:hypothetical protein